MSLVSTENKKQGQTHAAAQNQQGFMRTGGK